MELASPRCTVVLITMITHMLMVIEQARLRMHRDGSLVSFNVLLNNAADFTGGGTTIELLGQTITARRGDALMHCGKVRHAGRRITTGVRYILVPTNMWAVYGSLACLCVCVYH